MLNASCVHLNIPTLDIEKARQFYGGTLDLKEMSVEIDGVALYELAGGGRVEVFQRASVTPAEHTIGGFAVEDVEAVVDFLKKRGIVFEEYDLPGLKTEDGIARTSPLTRCAWFKDPEGHYLVVTELKPV